MTLVDDDRDTAEMYRLGLERLGFRVDVLSDGETFLDTVLGAAPDIVVLDWELPGMNGGDVLEGMRRHPRTMSLPVLMLSNYPVTAVGAIDRVFRAGAVAWLEKVKTPPRLLAAKLREALAPVAEATAGTRT